MLTKHDSDIVKGYIVRKLAFLSKEADRFWEETWKQHGYKAGRRQGIFFRKRLQDETLEEYRARTMASFVVPADRIPPYRESFCQLKKILDRVKNCDTVLLNDEEYNLIYDN